MDLDRAVQILGFYPGGVQVVGERCGRGGAALSLKKTMIRWLPRLGEAWTRCSSARGARWRGRRQEARPGTVRRSGRSRGGSGDVRSTSFSTIWLRKKNQEGVQGGAHGDEEHVEAKRWRGGELPSSEIKEMRWRQRRTPASFYGCLMAQTEGKIEGKERGARGLPRGLLGEANRGLNHVESRTKIDGKKLPWRVEDDDVTVTSLIFHFL